MIKRYNLNDETLPVIPTPHDWVINRLEYNSEFIVLNLTETGIIYLDQPPRDFAPDSKSLIMRFHLFDPLIAAYKWKKTISGMGFFEIDAKKLKSTDKNSLEYLYHNVGFNSIIIKLYQQGYIILDITAAYVELEWL